MLFVSSLFLSGIQAICFDIDGTLSDTDDLMVQRLARWLRPLVLLTPHYDAQTLARRVVMAAETPFNQLYAATDNLGLDAPIFRLVRLLRRLLPRRQPKRYLLIPGVAEMLAALAPRYRLGIVSAGSHQAVLDFLAHFDLQHYFGKCIASAETCKYTKPHPDPVRWAMNCLGVAPRACLMVGDTTVDILAGRAAGARTVGVLCGFGERDELQQAGADLILPSTADLLYHLL